MIEGGENLSATTIQSSPEQVKVVPNAAPLPVPEIAFPQKAEEAPRQPKLQVLLEKWGIDINKLDSETQTTLQKLADEKDAQKFYQGFADTLQKATETQYSSLTPQQQENLNAFRKLISGGSINSQNVLDQLGGYIDTLPEAISLPQEQRQEIKDTMKEIKEAVDKQDTMKVEKGTSKLMKILKAIGAIILALLGFGIFKASKLEGSRAPSMAAYQ